MSVYDDVYRESLHDWLDERPPPDRPTLAELEDEEYAAEKARLGEALGEDCPTHESPARLRMRLEYDRDEERWAS